MSQGKSDDPERKDDGLSRWWAVLVFCLLLLFAAIKVIDWLWHSLRGE
jgi:hypothetical protein